jgi:hypothetical protein
VIESKYNENLTFDGYGVAVVTTERVYEKPVSPYNSA